MNFPTEPSTPIKILVVDDTPANIDILFQTLEPEGCTLSVATSGEDALNLASEIQPDLILLDIMMPGIDGYETCRRLKEDESTCNIPVIFLTAKNQTKDIVIGLSAGGVDYITKPFRQEEVCARIRKHIQLQTLKNKLEDAIELNNDEEVAEITDEIEQIKKALNAGRDIHGQPRKVAGNVEKARKAVSKAYHESLKKIEDGHPALGKHFENTLTIGIYCSYKPEKSIHWDL